MPSLFRSPPKPPAPAAPMPLPDDKAISDAKKKAMRKMQTTSGRDSTILSSGNSETLGS